MNNLSIYHGSEQNNHVGPQNNRFWGEEKIFNIYSAEICDAEVAEVCDAGCDAGCVEVCDEEVAIGGISDRQMADLGRFEVRICYDLSVPVLTPPETVKERFLRAVASFFEHFKQVDSWRGSGGFGH